MDEFLVTLPYERLREVALLLGTQDTNACPPRVGSCWSKRGVAEQYFPEMHRIDAECSECWLTFLLLGVDDNA